MYIYIYKIIYINIYIYIYIYKITYVQYAYVYGCVWKWGFPAMAFLAGKMNKKNKPLHNTQICMNIQYKHIQCIYIYIYIHLLAIISHD